MKLAGKNFWLVYYIPLDKIAYWKIIFLFLNPNKFCGYSKELSQWDGSFEHPKHMFKLMGKEINAILGGQTILIWTYVYYRPTSGNVNIFQKKLMNFTK